VFFHRVQYTVGAGQMDWQAPHSCSRCLAPRARQAGAENGVGVPLAGLSTVVDWALRRNGP